MNKNSNMSIDEKAIDEVRTALSSIKWGSIEIFVQDSKVVQITERSIKKMATKDVSK